MTTAMRISDLYDSPPQPHYRGVKTTSQYLTMRDGVLIAVDVMLPADCPPDARLPALMIIARYWRSMDLRVPEAPRKAPIGPRELSPDFFVERGFAVVAMDVRGTGASTGVSRHPWSAEEIADYGEVARWVTEQPWCSGEIGAYGISYEGAAALRLAASGVAAVQGVIPQEIEYDIYSDIALPGGIPNVAFLRAWSESNQRLDANKTSSLFPWFARLLIKGVRPVDDDRRTHAVLKRAVEEHQANTDVYRAIQRIVYRDDPFGKTGVTLDDFSVFALNAAIENSRMPLFLWASWLDGTAADSALRCFNTYSNPQIAVIGAWKHEMTAHGSPYQKPGARPDPPKERQWAAMVQFFDRVLRQKETLHHKALFYYTLGAETWRFTPVFPLPDTVMQTWYFQPDHSLALAPSAVDDGTHAYTVDFEASTGRFNRWLTQMARPLVYADRAAEDQRLLTYTSPPLTEDLEITGYPVVSLYLSSSEEDGAFFVYLEDVDEDGVVRYITEGQLRGIHRRLATGAPPYWTGMPYRTFRRADASPMPRGEIVELTLGLQPTSVLIRRGHAIRVALAGADRDTFARIPAHRNPVWKVSHGRQAPSCIRLPAVAR